MSNTQQDSSLPDGASLSGRRVILGVVALAVVALFAWEYLGHRADQRQTDQKLQAAVSDNETLRKQMANLEATIADIKTAELYRQEEQTIARDGATVLLNRVRGIDRDVQSLADAESDWNAVLAELEFGDAGKRLASDPAHVELLATIIASAPETGASAAFAERLRPMIGQLESALAAESASFKPTQEFGAKLDEIQESLDTARQWYSDHLLQIEALHEEAATLDPGDRTLREALLAYETQRALSRVSADAERKRETHRQAEEMLRDAEAEAQQLIAEAEAEAARLAGEVEAARIRQEAAETKAKEEEEIRQREEALRLEQLKDEYAHDLADIKRKLQPFIADGNTLIGDAATQGPASLAILLGHGVLQEGRPGLQKLYYVGGDRSVNDRPRGPFPQWIPTERAWQQVDKEFLAKAQEYLRKYGELLVEEGLLAK